MPHYELMCIASTNASSKELATLLSKVSNIAVQGGGVVRAVDNLGTRPLAYRMRAHAKYISTGRFFRIQLQTNPTTAISIQRLLVQDQFMVRCLCLHKPLSAVGKEKIIHWKRYKRDREILEAADLSLYRKLSNVGHFAGNSGVLTQDQLLNLNTNTQTRPML